MLYVQPEVPSILIVRHIFQKKKPGCQPLHRKIVDEDDQRWDGYVHKLPEREDFGPVNGLHWASQRPPR